MVFCTTKEIQRLKQKRFMQVTKQGLSDDKKRTETVQKTFSGIHVKHIIHLINFHVFVTF